MSEEIKNTFSEYLGPEFQTKLMWQLLVEPEFAERVLDKLAIEYFDDDNMKRLFIVMLEYWKENCKPPNLQNKSVYQAVYTYKTPGSEVDEEMLLAVVDRIRIWNDRVINKNIQNDGDVVQKETNMFIKQQEYRKLGEYILTKVRGGEIKNKQIIYDLEGRFQRINEIGNDEDFGTEVVEGIEHALRKEFRETIPTGIYAIDAVTGNGLGRGEFGLLIAPSGVGKALPNSHKVLTPNGWIENGNLKVGDIVFGSDGKPQRVWGVYPQGVRKIYKIEFSDDTKSYCDSEHLWSVNSHKQRSSKTKINGKSVYFPDKTFQTLKTSEMINDFKLKGGKLNYRLPNIKPVEFGETELPINPYVLGVLLGDGCLTEKNQPHLITSDEFIKDKVMLLHENSSCSKYNGRFDGYKNLYRISILNSRKIFEKDLNLYGTDSSTKFIPEIYLRNSIKNRELLLQGLIDTDGTLQTNSTIIYTTVSEKLANNIRELVLSLGGTCRINKKKTHYYNANNEKISGKLAYNLTISFPSNGIVPCTLPKKLERFKYRDKYEFNKFIKNIDYSHDEEATCIYVENEDHLYVIDDYVLTHNTTLLTKIANTAYGQGKNVLQIVFEDTEDQIKRKHYAIWSKIGLQEMDDNAKEVAKRVYSKIDKINDGRLVIKKFSQEDTTIIDVKTWIERYQKKFNFKFDIVILDYLDKLEPHKKYGGDRNEAELSIVKSFEAMASDYNIPCWSAIQSNRSGFGAEFVTAHQTGGSIKRIQIAHFVMSIAKTDDQKEAELANIMILKARFAKDGHMFKNCVFNNNTLEIRITDERYLKGLKLKKHDDKDLEKLEEKASLAGMHSKISNHDVNDFKPETIIETRPITVGETEVVDRKIEENTHPEEEFHQKEIKRDAEEKQFVEKKALKKPESMSFEQKNKVNDLLKEMRDSQGDIRKQEKK